MTTEPKIISCAEARVYYIGTDKLFEYDGTAQAARFNRSEANLNRTKRITKPGEQKPELGI